MCESWGKDDDKVTFIILKYSGNPLESKDTEIANMIGDVNLFFHEYLQEDNEVVAEIEVMIADIQARRQGIAVEALQLLMENSQTKFKITKYLAKIKDSNVASIELFTKKLNFKFISTSDVFKEVTLELKV